MEVRSILKGVKGIKFVYFTEKDVVRHPLVQKIIKAYEGGPGTGGIEECRTERINLPRTSATRN